ncbi:MAG: DNA repair protein RecN [Alphaproteobacteria bacterium]|nr:DNA repair protein RecN [Alphaproteobacteria bacterium]
MLQTLSIRDVVLIERLELGFGPGLSVLTGETGAGKSILLDALGLALGGRADAGLVRAGAGQATVAAAFALPARHPAHALLAAQGIGAEGAGNGEIVLRRVLSTDGRSRAFINDEPVSIGLLRRLGALLVEVQGQWEQVGLTDPATQAALLDAFAGADATRTAVAEAWRGWRAADAALDQARASLAAAEREEDWLRHAVAELEALAPEPDEETELAAERQRLQQTERRAEAIAAAESELGHGRGAASMLRAAARTLERLPPPAEDVAPALAALHRAEEALAEAQTALDRVTSDAEADPRRLEQAEERLFALRAAARKHQVAVVELPALRASLAARLAALDDGTGRIAALTAAAAAARNAYLAAAAALSETRRKAGQKLDKAVTKELGPLKLEKTQFRTEITARAEADWGPDGTDRIGFLVATNPGQAPGPLAKIASGGELARLMLALKVVLTAGSAVPTLVFDEVDAGIGGATAAAVGERLGRLAERLQVLVVTHSPQVAARGAAHLRVRKSASGRSAATVVETLPPDARQEEIARMLSGATVTDAARAAAAALLAGGRAA